MSQGRDYSLVYKINKHFNDLMIEFENIKSLEEFSSSGTKRKSILLDLLQIGELVNRLSKPFTDECDSRVRKIVDVRNIIVHEYERVSDKKIFDILQFDLQPFIDNINTLARKRYNQDLNDLIGKNIEVYVNCLISENVYNCYYDELTTLEGLFQEVQVPLDCIHITVNILVDGVKTTNNKTVLIGHKK